MQILQFKSIALVSQGHEDFDHNENDFIYSKVIRLTGKPNQVSQKLKITTEDFKKLNLHVQIGSFRNLHLSFLLSGFFLYAPMTILTLKSHFS